MWTIFWLISQNKQLNGLETRCSNGAPGSQMARDKNPKLVFFFGIFINNHELFATIRYYLVIFILPPIVSLISNQAYDFVL